MHHLLSLLLATSTLATPPLHVANGQFCTPDGAPVGLFGANLYETHMQYARNQDPEPGLAELRAMAAAGFNFVRLPLSAGFIMPADNVLPDTPGYAKALADHGLKAGYVPLLDRFLDECGRLGMWALVEFHEYPTDPYRWFTGGDEQKRGTGQPGGGIDWMAAPGAIRRATPVMLGWLSGHWRGRAELLGFEVPHNEPHGDGPDDTGPGLKAFADDCCRSIKAADPQRLCVLAVGDWGAGVNRLDDSFVWDLPAGIDALTPHFYLGMHNNQSPLAEAYGVAPASWLSWFRGSGKPIIVGEWGTAHIGYPQFQKFDDSDRLTQRLTDACLAGWLVEGAQGVARWAWQGGIDDPERKQRLGAQAAAMLKYAEPYKRLAAGQASVGVVVAPQRRAPYGAAKDLTRIAAALLDLGVTPFDTLFPAQLAAQPEVLKRYRAVLVYTPDLDPRTVQQVRDSGVPVVTLADDAVDHAAVGQRLTAAGVKVQTPGQAMVWEFKTPGRLALFNRMGQTSGVEWAGTPGQRVVNRLTGEVVAEEGETVTVEWERFASRDLQLLGPGQEADRVALVPPPKPAVAGEQPLYDHGGVFGAWIAGWGGGQAAAGKDAEGLDVVIVTTTGVGQLGGFNLNQHQPVDLRPWLAAPGAVARLRLRVTAGKPTQLQLRVLGQPDTTLATVDLAPTGDWQTVDVPLARLQPAGRTTTLTGVLCGLLPSGALELGGVSLVREAGAGGG